MATGLNRPQEEWRVKPAYTMSQVANLAGVHTATVRRWLFGYSQPGHKMLPVFGPKDGDVGSLSFLEMAEIVVAAAFRDKGVALDRVRKARDYAATHMGLDFPFATIEMKKLGLHIVSEFQNQVPGPMLLALDVQGQLALPGLVAERLEAFDWLDKWASRWFPGGRSIPIVVDPQLGAGRLTVLDRGVTVENIMRRFTKGNQSPTYIALDLDLEESDVLNIIRYGAQHIRLLAA